MKQIDVMFERHLSGKKPLKAKWQIIERDGYYYIYHYHHLIVIYNLKISKIMYQWYECPTDKRGLDYVTEYLNNKLNK